MNKKLIRLLFLLLPAYSLTAMAVDGMNVDLGAGDESATQIGGSVKWNWDSRWFTEGDWYVGGYWEAGIAHWDGDSGKHRNDNITLIGVTPVFRLTRHNKLDNGMKPFFEGAIGFHLMSDDKIGDKDLGGNFTFGDHISGGAQFGDRLQHELSLRLQHFSNAGIYSDNQGMNFATIRYGYNFE